MMGDEEAKYHMKAKHLKEMGYQDALTFSELKDGKRNTWLLSFVLVAPCHLWCQLVPRT